MKNMISQAACEQHPAPWQKALRELVTDPLELLFLLKLSPEQIKWAWDKQFPIRVTQSFIARMEKGNPQDPLLRQVLSTPEESRLSNNYSVDPLQEKAFNPVPGLLHKFPNRVLLTFTGTCAIHCRYCFRRHFPYQENNPGRQGWSAALNYIAERKEIIEVILSGGDPLLATDETISSFLQPLALIPHVRLVRFHTRIPVVIPERITPSLIHALATDRFQISMIYHINHPAEIVPPIADGAKLLKQHNIFIFNQAVLLQGVNDDFNCLRDLCLNLYAAGILPYYIHLLDKVQGTNHFEVPIAFAKQAQQFLRENLPGYLVPHLVQEVPYQASKIPIDML